MPKNLLVADDSVVIQKSIGISLAQEDLAITYVGNGEDALAKAREAKPDLILADVMMPKKNGYEVCEAIKQDPALQNTPVLLLAGTHEPFDEGRGKTAGADGHIIKPFESKTLLENVRSMLSGSGPVVATTATAPSPVQPVPQASPPPIPEPQASPASTIAGQSPLATMPPISPPPVTVTTSEPAPTPVRDAPMLDLNVEETAPPAADFSEAPTIGAMVEPQDGAAPVDVPPLQDTDDPPTQKLPEPDGFWDFSQEAVDSTPVTPEPTPVPAAPEPAPVEASPPTVEVPTQEAPWQASAPAVSNAVPATAEVEAPTPPAEDFGFDLSTEEASPMEIEPIAAVPLEKEETASLPAPTPQPQSREILSLSDVQIETIVTKVFQKVIERIAWEVVPDLAERIIKEELSRLTKESS